MINSWSSDAENKIHSFACVWNIPERWKRVEKQGKTKRRKNEGKRRKAYAKQNCNVYTGIVSMQPFIVRCLTQFHAHIHCLPIVSSLCISLALAYSFICAMCTHFVFFFFQFSRAPQQRHTFIHKTMLSIYHLLYVSSFRNFSLLLTPIEIFFACHSPYRYVDYYGWSNKEKWWKCNKTAVHININQGNGVQSAFIMHLQYGTSSELNMCQWRCTAHCIHTHTHTHIDNGECVHRMCHCFG